MEADGEVAGDILTGGVVAAAIEGEAGAPGEKRGARVTCLNCGADVNGAYCAACGQAAHIHRSLLSLGHDILHGVFHFEGKIWRTLPELFLHPGRLTRRYIDGERARFISPMALFLFTVFLMFAVFSFTGGALLSEGGEAGDVAIANWKQGNQSAIDTNRQQIAKLQEELATPGLTPERRAAIEDDINSVQSALIVMEALHEGDWGRIAELDEKVDAAAAESSPGAKASFPGSPAIERRLNEGLKQLNENPSLLLYKLKANGYKFSWALIPLSLPFMWLLFFWRRDIHLYDHAIFTTYSITFMMMLLVLLSLARTAGVPSGVWEAVLFFAPPVHMYRQLRGAYDLSRFGALVRLFFLLIAAAMVLAIFSVLLLLMGALT